MSTRHTTPALLIACVLTLSLVNWCTTCCCGRPMIIELLEGGCECGHDHEHLDRDHEHASAHQHDGDHDGSGEHSCLKAMKDWNHERPDDSAGSDHTDDGGLVFGELPSPAGGSVSVLTANHLARAGPQSILAYLLHGRLLL